MLLYDTNYLPALRLDSTIDVQNEWPSIMATADDMKAMKSGLRRLLPDLKPTERLEYLARAFSYRSAASFQSDMKAATPARPVILTPREGYPDPYRMKHLLAREQRFLDANAEGATTDSVDSFQVTMRDVAGLLCCEIRDARTPSYWADLDSYDPDHAGLVAGLEGDRMHLNADLAVPSLDGRLMRAASLDFEECSWDPGLEDGETVQLLDVDVEMAFSAEEIQFQSEGDYPPLCHRGPRWAVNQEASRHRHRATLIHRQENGLLAGSLTFEISCAPVSVERAMAEARTHDVVLTCHPDDRDDCIEAIADTIRCGRWECCLRIEQSTTHKDLNAREIDRNRTVLEAAVMAMFDDYLTTLAMDVAGSMDRKVVATINLAFNPDSVWGCWEEELSEWTNAVINGLNEQVDDGIMGVGEMRFQISRNLASFLEDELDIHVRRV